MPAMARPNGPLGYVYTFTTDQFNFLRFGTVLINAHIHVHVHYVMQYVPYSRLGQSVLHVLIHVHVGLSEWPLGWFPLCLGFISCDGCSWFKSLKEIGGFSLLGSFGCFPFVSQSINSASFPNDLS